IQFLDAVVHSNPLAFDRFLRAALQGEGRSATPDAGGHHRSRSFGIDAVCTLVSARNRFGGTQAPLARTVPFNLAHILMSAKVIHCRENSQRNVLAAAA